jgi:hypothetical protein
VPKQWFSHFYIAGLAWQLVLWMVIVDAFWASTRLAGHRSILCAKQARPF